MQGPRTGEGILRRKPIEHIEETEAGQGPRLERTLGLWQLTAIGVGGIIGAGIFTVASAVIMGFLPIGEAAELTNIGILLAFVVVSAAVIVLHRRRPELPRTFRTPGMPVVPLLGIAFSLWLITFLHRQTWVRFVVWFLLGVVVYFGYSYRHSLLARTNR